jgi:hypothetical protein
VGCSTGMSPGLAPRRIRKAELFPWPVRHGVLLEEWQVSGRNQSGGRAAVTSRKISACSSVKYGDGSGRSGSRPGTTDNAAKPTRPRCFMTLVSINEKALKTGRLEFFRHPAGFQIASDKSFFIPPLTPSSAFLIASGLCLSNSDSCSLVVDHVQIQDLRPTLRPCR